jgi:hypothetical protein
MGAVWFIGVMAAAIIAFIVFADHAEDWKPGRGWASDDGSTSEIGTDDVYADGDPGGDNGDGGGGDGGGGDGGGGDGGGGDGGGGDGGGD